MRTPYMKSMYEINWSWIFQGKPLMVHFIESVPETENVKFVANLWRQKRVARNARTEPWSGSRWVPGVPVAENNSSSAEPSEAHQIP